MNKSLYLGVCKGSDVGSDYFKETLNKIDSLYSGFKMGSDVGSYVGSYDKSLSEKNIFDYLIFTGKKETIK